MKDKDIDTIAKAIAAKLGEPGGSKLLGCGSASSSDYFDCTSLYNCSSYYECGGANSFVCWYFDCDDNFRCVHARYTCVGDFDCHATYTEY